MNAVDLLKLLNATSWSEEETERVCALAKEYPQFFLLQALAAKMQMAGSETFPETLNHASLLSGNRESLHRFITGQKEEIQKKEPELTEPELTEPLAEIRAEPPAEVEVHDEHSEPKMEDDELMELLHRIHERKQSILNIKETTAAGETPPDAVAIPTFDGEYNALELEEEDEEVFTAEEGEAKSLILLDDELAEQVAYEQHEDLLLTNEIAGGGAEFVPTEYLKSEDANEELSIDSEAEITSSIILEKEILKQEMEEPIQEQPEIIVPEITATVEEPALEPASEMASPDSGLRINETVNSPGEFLPDKSYTFTQWLKFFRHDGKHRPKEKKTEQRRQETVVPVPDPQSLSRGFQHELDAIDKVVPKTAVAATGEISAGELAERSSILSEELMSETLAGIYEQQGRYDKAIRQYVKLSLKYPEKVSFFAARIKELKSKK